MKKTDLAKAGFLFDLIFYRCSASQRDTRDWIALAQVSGVEAPALRAESSSAMIALTSSPIPDRSGVPTRSRISATT